VRGARWFYSRHSRESGNPLATNIKTMKKYIISIFVLIFCVNFSCYSRSSQWHCPGCVVPDTVMMIIIEDPPQFPGGEEARREHMVRNLKHLTEKYQDIQGRIYVRFCIEKDGSITGVEILRGLDDRIDSEVVRIVEAMPKWEPGRQRGRPVCAPFRMPVRFNIEYPIWNPSGIQHETPLRTRNRRQR